MTKTPRDSFNSSLRQRRASTRQAGAAEGKKRQRTGQSARPCQARAAIDPDRRLSADASLCQPTHCHVRGRKLAGRDGGPWRHQVWELTEIKPIVTAYRRHRLTCRRCGETTCGTLPPGAPTGQAGPRMVALAAMLMGCFKRSKRRVALFLEEVLNQPCSVCWEVKLQNQATAG